MINTCRLRFMVKPHTSDIRMTYEYIRAKYGWHTSTYEWHTDNIREHMSDIRMTYEYIQVTYEHIRMPYEYIRVAYGWHTNTYCFGLFTKIKKGSGISFWCTFSTWIFSYKCSLFNTLSINKVSTLYLFTKYQTKCVIKFLFTQLMTS